MKRILASILGLVGLLTAPAAFAQSSTHTPFSSSQYYAADYGQWGIRGQQANYYQFSPGGLCYGSAAGGQFFLFATNAPVLISDAVAANTEVVTPSTVSNTGSTCGFTGSPVNSHTSFQVSSGTAGLQEALNALATVGGKTTSFPARVVLDRNWYGSASSVPGTTPSAILTAAKGNAHAFLEDITTAASTLYVWNGTSYVTGTWVNTKPTSAAGAAAGTSPTITSAGTALTPTVALTEGTAPTTGTLFTLTWATTGQFLYAPTCTVTSTGANSFTAFTVATSYASSAATLTVTATSAPTASTAYKFAAACY